MDKKNDVSYYRIPFVLNDPTQKTSGVFILGDCWYALLTSRQLGSQAVR